MAAAKTRQSTDDEITVLDSLAAILELLDDAACERVLVWAYGRFVGDGPPSTVHGGPSWEEAEEEEGEES